MNKEQAEKLYNENSNLKLKFVHYYKYSFCFAGENDAIKVYVKYGGNDSDIYRFDVDDKEFEAPKTFNELMENYYSVDIINKKTNEGFDDYHY